ncbi:hypothetical protein HWV62_2788 [Athelia sp. TMB]|nr:hypothetical protein HWV62_2788 [Athelia sp. TMB]
MRPYDLDARNDSSPSAPSSPMLVTPFTSSSPPGRTYFQHARRLSSQTAASDYSDPPEDISPAWGAAARPYAGHPIKALPPARATWGAHGPAWAAEMDTEPAGTAWADSSDEEEDEDGGVHSRFALSSERGRWKSSPLPMKTYSRAPPRASTSAAPPPAAAEKRNIRKLGVHSDLPRASSPVAPAARTMRLSSPLPPSSPPMSPVSVAHALPEDDYTTEEDMLVDDDAEPPQQSSKTKVSAPICFVPSSQLIWAQISSLLNPMDSDEEDEADDSALIPPIATLDFAAAFRTAKAKTASPPPAAPSCAGSMPTPEPTPAPPELAVEPAREPTPIPELPVETAAPPPREPTPLPVSAVSLPTPESAEPEKAPPAAEKQPLADTSNMNAQVMIRTPSSHVPPELAPAGAAGLTELTVEAPSSPLTECMDLADTRAPTPAPMVVDVPISKQAPVKKAKKDAHKTNKASSSSDERAPKSRKALEPKASSSNADAAPAPRPRTVSGKRKAKEEKEEAAVEADAPTRKRAKVPAKERESAAGPSSAPSKNKSKRRPSHSEPKPTPQPAQLPPARVAELQGMVIEAFAVARASALPASALLASMAGSRPGLRAGAGDVEAALEAGLRACGMFGKVESSFRDDRDRARGLEAKWFYVPERDADQERAGLIRSMMPRAAKRSETKKYKQYYFQPLDKISRWDPEDDL